MGFFWRIFAFGKGFVICPLRNVASGLRGVAEVLFESHHQLQKVAQAAFFVLMPLGGWARRAKQTTTRYAGGEQKVIPKNLLMWYNKMLKSIVTRKEKEWQTKQIVYPILNGFVSTT